MGQILQMSLYNSDDILDADEEEKTHLHNPEADFGRQPKVCCKTGMKKCAYSFLWPSFLV